ncbi:P-loop containing nucleoside triphosphate hydrolase protein [Colletotrichum somersetense]|nr:P-loop containing nucleoside triphosphate hydrolase protein [Colletotrichum somersetense]
MIVGPAASGKSTLLKGLLGETPFTSGDVILGVEHRRVGHCDHSPFLYNNTIKANIIGHSEFEPQRYGRVVNTLKGLATLRALGFINSDVRVNDELILNASQRPSYQLSIIQRWLQQILKLMVAVLASIVVTLATQLRASSGLTGASLITLMSFGETLTTIVLSYTSLETSVGAVARIKTFSDTVAPETRPGEDLVPERGWLEQDGFTVWENLDPFRAAAEAECLSVLEQVGLLAVVQERGGIDANFAADSLSQRQKQLFCLARAVLRRRVESRNRTDGGVLRLDEVSSSVDRATDLAMQDIIRREFDGYTVIMVPHRLDMVLECDTAFDVAKVTTYFDEGGHEDEIFIRRNIYVAELDIIGPCINSVPRPVTNRNHNPCGNIPPEIHHQHVVVSEADSLGPTDIIRRRAWTPARRLTLDGEKTASRLRELGPDAVPERLAVTSAPEGERTLRVRVTGNSHVISHGMTEVKVLVEAMEGIARAHPQVNSETSGSVPSFIWGSNAIVMPPSDSNRLFTPGFTRTSRTLHGVRATQSYFLLIFGPCYLSHLDLEPNIKGPGGQ